MRYTSPYQPSHLGHAETGHVTIPPIEFEFQKKNFRVRLATCRAVGARWRVAVSKATVLSLAASPIFLNPADCEEGFQKFEKRPELRGGLQGLALRLVDLRRSYRSRLIIRERTLFTVTCDRACIYIILRSCGTWALTNPLILGLQKPAT